MNFKHAFFTIIFIFQFILTTQSQVSGTVLSEDKTPINKVQIYNSNGGIITETDIKGYFEFSIKIRNFEMCVQLQKKIGHKFKKDNLKA